MLATETNAHAASFASPACTPPASPAPPAPVRRRLAGAGAGGPARPQPPGAARLSRPAPSPRRPLSPPPRVAPFPRGSGSDITARTGAKKRAEQNHGSVLVDTRPGAGGNLGVDSVAKSAPDGHTLVLGQTNNLAINPTLYPQLP